MRVVITGATGNVGTSLLEALANEPEVSSVAGIARRVPDRELPKTSWIRADVASDDLVSHFRDADVVVHLAWIFQPTHDPVATWRNNALGSIRVFDAVAAAGVPALIHASSVGAYSPGPVDEAVDETWPTHALPTAAYGREKSYVERVLDTFEQVHPEVRVVRLRPGFIFKRESASEQRRLFAGHLLPRKLVRRGLIPFVPDAPGLRFQAVHSLDVGEAYRLAVTSDVRGAFNIAADPVIDPPKLAEILGARLVRVSPGTLRGVAALTWRLRLQPTPPGWLDLALETPLLDTTRARTELGWTPSRTATESLLELMEGVREGAGRETPPLDPDTSGPLRSQELATGIGEREGT